MENYMLKKCKIGVASIDNSTRDIQNYFCTMKKKSQKKYILVIGLTNPCFFCFYEKLREKYKSYELIWMRYKKNYEETYTHGFIIKIPQDISRINYHLLTEDVSLTEIEINKINNNREYRWAYENIMAVHPYDNPNMVRRSILLTEYYFEKVYSIIQPAAVLMWNPYVSFNKIAENVAKRNNIKVAYMESGVLPGTISFSTWGDLGESRPSKEPSYFMELPIDTNEINRAEEVINFLRDSGFNRNIQPKLQTKVVLKPGRPTIFFAGQNDSECGLVPFEKKTNEFSPCFRSSEEAMIFLAEIAYKNDWNFIYKPHPIVARHRLEQVAIPSNVIYIMQGDINKLIDICDVCVTILSTTAYISLIREKPVVMLGKIQLNGQGCTYEAYNRDVIERTIHEAVENGYSLRQKENFKAHIARMCKYYLYDSFQKRDISYGLSTDEAISYINKLLEGEVLF